MKITEHFEDWEFRVSSDYPELAKEIELLWDDLLKLWYISSCILELARSLYEEPFIVTSGKRTAELNSAIHGAEQSDHLFLDRSCAVDFAMRRKQKLLKVYGWIHTHCHYSVGEMILYLDKRWKPRFIHVSLPTKKHHSEFYFDYNRGENFDLIDKLPGTIYIDIFTKEVR